MESKYYTPEIEEFHVGFEYEYKETFLDGTVKSKEQFDNAKWVESISSIGDSPYVHRALSGKIADNKRGGIRVKYLDKEDIESFGFKKSIKDSWIGYKDYFLSSINPEYPYFLYATLHIPLRDDMYKILVHRHYDENEGVDIVSLEEREYN